MREYRSELCAAAVQARSRAYCPYSHYAVGAAVLTDKGDIITGCNVENASYGLFNCGERTAIFKAVSEGAGKILAIAIAGAGEPPYPCGACRQVMAEFAADGKIPVYVVTAGKGGEEGGEDPVEEFTLDELLPHRFSL